MLEPSLRRSLVAVAAAASSLTLTAALVSPSVAGASARNYARAHAALIKLKSSKEYGKILVSSSGHTLYFLTADTPTTLACTTGCTSLWRPLLTKRKPRAGKGIAKKMLGTEKRGSSLQVTYDGHPLYFYTGDSAAGQVNGEGIASFGGRWYVLSGTGAPVKATMPPSGGMGGGGGYGSSGGWDG